MEKANAVWAKILLFEQNWKEQKQKEQQQKEQQQKEQKFCCLSKNGKSKNRKSKNRLSKNEIQVETVHFNENFTKTTQFQPKYLDLKKIWESETKVQKVTV